MAWVDIDNLGEHGIVRDRLGIQLPHNAWTDGGNIRICSDNVRTMAGWQRHFTPLCRPIVVFGLNDPIGENYYIVYACDAKVYAFDNAVHHDITPAAGLASALQWTGDIINGNLVLSNGVDAPIYWDVDVANPMQTLPGLDGMDSCRVIRSHKGFLFALDCVIGGLRRPARCRWSGQAEVGLPPTWDPVGSLAGEVDLGDSDQDLIEAKILRDHLIIYGSRQTFDVSFIGGSFVWRFDTLFQSNGILGVHCALEFHSKHVVLTAGDVLVHNGHTTESPINDIDRRWLFERMSDTQYSRSFLARDFSNDEIWICFPEEGSDYPNIALVWDYRHNTWSMTDLPSGTAFIGNARDLLQGGGDFVTYETWDTDYASIDYSYADMRAGIGNQPSDDPNPSILAMLTASDTEVYKMDAGNRQGGAPRYSWIERQDLNLSPQRAVVRRMRPRMDGGQVDVYIGGQDIQNGPVRWTGPYPFTPGRDIDIHCRVSGLRHAMRFESRADDGWCLNSYGLDVEEMGNR